MRDLELTSEQQQRADALHQRSIVVDMLWSTNPAEPTPLIDGKNALDRAIDAGLTAANNTLAGANTNFRDAIKEINKVYRLLESEPDKTLLVQTTADIERAKAERKLGIIMGFQNASPLEDDWINTLPVFHKLGVRIIQLTYNENNLLGSGCTEPRDGGLTAYGRQVVRALNRLGIIIDLSHVGQQTAREAIELSEDPVIVSHANTYALTPHVRNLPDDTIKALAAKGGVMGIVAWNVICATRPGVKPSLSDYLDHLDYVVNLVGVDHVGIGSDINENFRAMPIRSDFETRYSYMLTDPSEKAPAVEGFQWVHELPNVTRGLVARGYSDEDIQKILGGNFLRVARAVWDKN